MFSVEIRRNITPVYNLGENFGIPQYVCGRTNTEIIFDWGLKLSQWDAGRWVIADLYYSENPSAFLFQPLFQVGNVLTTSELLYLVPQEDIIMILKNIKLFSGINMLEFMEQVTDPDMRDFILFNLDILA